MAATPEQLIAALNDEDDFVAREAVLLLGSLRNDSFVPEFISAFNRRDQELAKRVGDVASPDSDTRSAYLMERQRVFAYGELVIWTLAAMATPSALGYLERVARRADDGQFRKVAQEALEAAKNGADLSHIFGSAESASTNILPVLLETVQYSTESKSYSVHHTRDASWWQVKAAIRKLDQYFYPALWLRLQKDPPKVAVPSLGIIGGDGAYVLRGHETGRELLFFEEKPNGDYLWTIWMKIDEASPPNLELCESSMPRKHICQDQDLVVKLARHFCEHGTLDQSVHWKVTNG